ncbi:MAG: Flp pilus assembly protein CpaB [Rhodobacterales bacterium]|nr:MAG: Flp pilus assembly protein CpaB [Rhodobacterales bacterium]
MRSVFGLVLIAGLGLAGLAVYMAKNQFSAYQNALAAQRSENVPVIEIYVAKRPLKYGEPLKPEDVRLAKWPVSSLPQKPFRTEEQLFPKGLAVHRVVLRAIETNEPLMAVKVTKPGESAGLTSQLERGMRAFAIEVDVSSGVSGFLRPGDRVDVYWTGQIRAMSEGAKRGEVTKLIETGVKLIAVDQSANDELGEATIARTVTVAASPQQVAALAQAQSTGKLSLSLVGVGDDTIAETIEVDQRSLLGLAEAPITEQVEEEKSCTIRTRRGAEVVEIPIPCTN